MSNSTGQESAMKRMLDSLEELTQDEFKRFHWFLQQPGIVEGFQPLQKRLLENADRMKTVDLIMQSYSELESLRVVIQILKKMTKDDIESAMEARKKRMLDILEKLNQEQFEAFQRYLQQPGIVKGFQPLHESHLENADRMKTVDLIMQFNPGRESLRLVIQVLKKMNKDDLVRSLTLDIPYLLEILFKKLILDILEKLDPEEFEMFQCYLQQPVNIKGFQPLQKSLLENADRMKTVDLIMQFNPERKSLRLVKEVLKKMEKYDLVSQCTDWLLKDDTDDTDEMMSPDILEGPKEKKRKINQEELRDDPDASTSTTQRKWHTVSKRWKPQFEKLVKMADSEVTNVKNLVFGEHEEFRIGEGSNGVEVFLGLRDDGTEVAVKRMSKTCSLYKDLQNEQEHVRLPELDDPSIVRYVDFVEDKRYGYLVLQLCEETLEEYITKVSEQERKRLAKQFLNSLRILHCQPSKILHRDIKPQNVLIDSQGKPRLADFGISRRIVQGKTTYHTNVAGTPCWMAKETLDKKTADYKRSTDIQVAGMLIYYILSGGHHPFGDDIRCEVNILEDRCKLDHVDDMVAKDLIECMIHGEPEKRPKVEQCLAHPFFWPNKWRVEYLGKIGNEKDFIPALDKNSEQGQYNAWKQKFREAEDDTRTLFKEMATYKMKEGKEKYSDNLLGLLRFIRNLLHHPPPEGAARIDLLEMFPGLFGYVYKFAKEQDWNSRPTLEEMFDFCPRCAVTFSLPEHRRYSTSASSTRH